MAVCRRTVVRRWIGTRAGVVVGPGTVTMLMVGTSARWVVEMEASGMLAATATGVGGCEGVDCAGAVWWLPAESVRGPTGRGTVGSQRLVLGDSGVREDSC